MTETRTDLIGRLDGKARTPLGGIRAPAYLTRTGVFNYKTSDGKTVRELRHPDEVFKADSLATLRGAPVTVGHPGMLDASNWRGLAAGHVGDDVRSDSEKFVAADVVVNDADVVKRIDAGELSELSCGYSCDVKHEPGEYNGEKYDAVQTNIRYNHVGLGPKNWGRAGNDVALRLDGFAGDIAILAKNAMDAAEKGQSEITPSISEDKGNEKSMDLAQLTAQNADLQKRLDAMTAERDALRVERDSARADSAEDKIAARVAARVALVEGARKVLGAEYKADGKTDRDVLVDCVVASDREFKADGRSDDYLRARFDLLVSQAPAAKQALEAVRGDAAGAPVVAGPTDSASSAKARENMHKRNADAWKTHAK